MVKEAVGTGWQAELEHWLAPFLVRLCEQVHRQLKEELGLDHFEGRSWAGLHRHALMTMLACAFLQTPRLMAAKGGKHTPGPPPEPSLPAVRRTIQQHLFGISHGRCPHSSRSLGFHLKPFPPN